MSPGSIWESEESSDEELIPARKPVQKSPSPRSPSPFKFGSSADVNALDNAFDKLPTPSKAKKEIPFTFVSLTVESTPTRGGSSKAGSVKEFSFSPAFGAASSLRKDPLATIVPALQGFSFGTLTKIPEDRASTSPLSFQQQPLSPVPNSSAKRTKQSMPLPLPFSPSARAFSLRRPSNNGETPGAKVFAESVDSHAAELEFLGHGAPSNTADLQSTTAPLVTRDAFGASSLDHYPFKSLLGSVKEQCAAGFPSSTEQPQLYLNVAAPFSAVVCGVQGSGKSHSLSAVLESCFISHPAVGSVPAPLAGLAFCYGSTGVGQPSEAAYLSMMQKKFAKQGSKAPDVQVLVSPSSLETMRRTYSSLPQVRVDALQLAHSDLNASRLLALMANEDESKIPLYMTSVLALIRAQGSDGFHYQRLREQINRLSVQDLNEAQQKMLALRLSLLDSFCSARTKRSVKSFFAAGRLTIIDLSDPFLGEAAACTLFDIMLGLFLEADTGCKGKIIALDEAHTFLSSSSSSKLIASLTSIIRLQRHLGVRTVISTQEPTCVPPAILDLVSFILAHRFSSPAWASHLDKHVCTRADTGMGWFDAVANLGIGEACLFSPSMVGLMEGKGKEEGKEGRKVARIGRGYLVVQIRKRLTRDGGMSITAV